VTFSYPDCLSSSALASASFSVLQLSPWKRRVSGWVPETVYETALAMAGMYHARVRGKVAVKPRRFQTDPRPVAPNWATTLAL
jgi:hypothetical protein